MIEFALLSDTRLHGEVDSLLVPRAGPALQRVLEQAHLYVPEALDLAVLLAQKNDQAQLQQASRLRSVGAVGAISLVMLIPVNGSGNGL